MRDIALNGLVYVFPVGFDLFDMKDILLTNVYLMKKYKMK